MDDRGWHTKLDSLVWARLFGATDFATDAPARTAAMRTLERLASKGLVKVERERGSRNISVILLREDGSGDEYTRPGVDGNKDDMRRDPLRSAHAWCVSAGQEPEEVS